MPLRRRPAHHPSVDDTTPSDADTPLSGGEPGSPESAASPVTESKKGRPTPSRKEREAANRRPIVVKDRKSANKAARAAARRERQAEVEAMRTNNQSKLPARDRGPVRAYVRDYVDARWNIGELFLFIAFALLLLSMFFTAQGTSRILGTILVYGIYVIVILAVVDATLLWHTLKKRLTSRFGADAIEKGLLLYTLSRSFQIRRARLPKPRQKKHGHYPS